VEQKNMKLREVGQIKLAEVGQFCLALKLQTLRSAEDALEALINESFDIIIADYKLPGIDGLEFFKKADELNSEAVKILITAYGSKELFTKALNMGIHDCIEKPFTSEIIEDSLKRLLNIDR